MARRVAHFVLVLILAEIATSLVVNKTILENNNNIVKGLKTRRKDHSTSSDSDSVVVCLPYDTTIDVGVCRSQKSCYSYYKRENKDKESDSQQESLNVVFTSDSESDSEDSDGMPKATKYKKKDREPKSTIERKGWRKWHRKCTKCPEDMLLKWRDPSIKWICGAYQQARRTFKSLCMMYFRNCQDGTMFTKIADHRCPNGSLMLDGVHPYKHHFFYDYKVTLTDDDTSSDTQSFSDDDSEQSTSVSNSEIEKNIPPFIFDRDR